MLDDCLYPGDPFRSAVASLGLGTVGMLASQGIVNKMDLLVAGSGGSRIPFRQMAARFGAIYVLAGSCILIWRGTWVMWDVVYEHAHHCPIQKTGPRATDEHHATYSGLVSHVTATVALVSCGLFASVLAPPAAVAVVTNAAVTAASRKGMTTSTMAGTTQYYQRILPKPATSSSAAALSRRAAATVSAIGKHISPRNDRVLARPPSFAFGGTGMHGMGMSSSASTTRRGFATRRLRSS